MRMRGQGLFISACVSKDRQSEHTVRGERSVTVKDNRGEKHGDGGESEVI